MTNNDSFYCSACDKIIPNGEPMISISVALERFVMDDGCFEPEQVEGVAQFHRRCVPHAYTIEFEKLLINLNE